MVLIPLALALAACIALAGSGVALGVHRRPTGTLEDVGSWTTGSDGQVGVESTVRVRNRNRVLSALGRRFRAAYVLELNGVRVARGDRDRLQVPFGTETVTLQTEVETDQIPPWWVAFVAADETIDLAAGGTIGLDSALLPTTSLPQVHRELLTDETPIIDALTAAADDLTGRYTIDSGRLVERLTAGLLPLGEAGVTVGYEIERGWATWADVTAEQSTVRFHFAVRNAGDVPVPALPQSIQMTVDANEITLFRTDDSGTDLVEAATEPPLDPGESRVVEYPVRMENEHLGAWFQSHVTNDELTHLDVRLSFAFQPPGLDVPVSIPPDGVRTVSCTVQTGILIDQPTETDCRGLHSAVTDDETR